MKIQEFYDKLTGTLTYVASDSKKCIIIDPIMNYDQFSGKISYESANEVIDFIKKEGFELVWILETHIHADHLSGCEYIKNKAKEEGFGASVKSAIGENVAKVTKYWGKSFDFDDKSLQKASDFDKLLKDGEKIEFGDTQIEVISTPGHTPCCVSYKIGDNVFVGDLIFMPDIGTARCDFPGGDAKTSYESIQKIYALANNVKIYTGHDYPKDRDFKFCASVEEEKAQNVMAPGGISQEDFIKSRTKRDSGLPVPKLLYPSLQVNIFAGKIDEMKFLKIPLKK